MKMGSGLAPLSQPAPKDSVDPVREYMRQMAQESMLPSETALKVPEPEQRGFLIGGVRL